MARRVRIRLASVSDIEDAKELHAIAFPHDLWPGDDHQFWVARTGTGKLAGMYSANLWEDANSVFFSRGAVALKYQGAGIYQQMIRHCLRWASKQGAESVITYTVLHNYESIGGLLAAGFRFVIPEKAGQFVGPNVHYFSFALPKATQG